MSEVPSNLSKQVSDVSAVRGTPLEMSLKCQKDFEEMKNQMEMKMAMIDQFLIEKQASARDPVPDNSDKEAKKLAKTERKTKKLIKKQQARAAKREKKRISKLKKEAKKEEAKHPVEKAFDLPLQLIEKEDEITES